MKLFLITLLTALPIVIFAQSNYRQGYLIKNSGDTLRGYIDYGEWVRCPVAIDFKAQKGDAHALRFDPHTAKGFQVTGVATYASYKGMISMDRTKFPDIPMMLDTSQKMDTVFLKQVVTGSYLTLFSHQDDVKIRYFIAENGRISELKYSQYMQAESQPVEKNIYKGQLIVYINELAPKNSGLFTRAERAAYNEGDLSEIVNEINGSSNPVERKPFCRVFAGFGLSSNETELNDNVNTIEVPETESTITNLVIEPLHLSRHTTTVSPKFNFGIDFFNNPDVQRLIFRAELSFSTTKAAFFYQVYDGSHGNIPLNYSYDQFSSTFTPQIIYNIYNKDNFKCYVDGGVALNFSNYTANSDSHLHDMNSFWPSFPLQAGIVINRKFELSVSYAGYAYLTPFGDGPFNIKNKSMSAGFKYLF